MLQLPSQITFPREEPITLRVATLSGAGIPPVEAGQQRVNPALRWLAEKTNITLEFVTVPGQDSLVRGITLGEMARSGTLPDLVASRLVSDLGAAQQLFVNLSKHPGLMPVLADRIAADKAYADAIDGLRGPDGQLYSIGRYQEQLFPFVGAIAYRVDLFEKLDLVTGTWDDLRQSLHVLRSQYPEAYPFGAHWQELLFMGPSWFGSGLDRQLLAYFDPERAQWRFGPFEQSFEDFVWFFARLYRDGLLHPAGITAPRNVWRSELLTRLTRNLVFLTPWQSGTGLSVPGSTGGLTQEGSWDGEGAWFGPLPLPRGRASRAWIRARPWSPMGPGWSVSRASTNAAEAIGLLDYLLRNDAALMTQVGPMPLDRSRLATQKEALLQRALLSPVLSREVDLFLVLQLPSTATRDYFIKFDVSTYREGGNVVTAPWPALADHTRSRMATLSAALQPLVIGEVLRFITGARPLAEYDDFVRETKDSADRLLELLGAGSPGIQ